jgi:hypothetical protein
MRTFLVFVAAGLLTLAAFAQSPFATPGGLARFNSARGEIPGLVAWWKLDATNSSAQVTDSGPSGYTGTAIGLPGVVAGKVNNAFSFNGSSQWVTNCGTVNSFAFIHTNRVFTLSAWVFLNSISTNTGSTILSSTGTSAESGFILLHDNRLGISTNALRLLVTRGVGGSFSLASQSLHHSLPTNEWLHIVVGHDSAAPSVFWFNGTNVALAHSTNGPIGSGAMARATAIGYAPNSSGGTFPCNGRIDDVRIYNRALSATEVGWLYNGGSGTGGNP